MKWQKNEVRILGIRPFQIFDIKKGIPLGLLRIHDLKVGVGAVVFRVYIYIPWVVLFCQEAEVEDNMIQVASTRNQVMI